MKEVQIRYKKIQHKPNMVVLIVGLLNSEVDVINLTTW